MYNPRPEFTQDPEKNLYKMRNGATIVAAGRPCFFPFCINNNLYIEPYTTVALSLWSLGGGDPEDDPKIEAEKLDELYEQDKKQRKCAEAEAAKEENLQSKRWGKTRI